jgi:muramoyltetrapeptide carboxypeptidase LdcA involved in peptidoglycan recycling
MRELLHPAKPRRGEKVAVLSPSFAVPAVAPEVHEQALRRFADVTGLIPVEYPTTRTLGASPRERAADVNAALADPEIRAIVSTIGGSDQIRVVMRSCCAPTPSRSSGTATTRTSSTGCG